MAMATRATSPLTHSPLRQRSRNLLIALWIFWLPLETGFSPLKERVSPRFVVWNIGQGQWASLVQAGRCDHFDVGGERIPGPKLSQYCQGQDNIVHLSHWDWDHIRYLRWLHRRLRGVCLAGLPLASTNERRLRWARPIPLCSKDKQLPPWLQLILPPPDSWSDSNGSSRVYIAFEKILIPGDARAREESSWPTEALAQVEFLLLGHHGSNTSTSSDLLNRLPRLKQSIASARAAAYGHPHPEVVLRHQTRGIPLLRTEQWGHLIFELSLSESDLP